MRRKFRRKTQHPISSDAQKVLAMRCGVFRTSPRYFISTFWCLFLGGQFFFLSVRSRFVASTDTPPPDSTKKKRETLQKDNRRGSREYIVPPYTKQIRVSGGSKKMVGFLGLRDSIYHWMSKVLEVFFPHFLWHLKYLTKKSIGFFGST